MSFFGVERSEDGLSLRLRRDVPGDDHVPLVAELEAIVSEAATSSKMVIDLTALTFASAHVLGSLVKITKRRRGESGELELSFHPKVYDMITAYDFDKVFPIRRSSHGDERS